MKCSLFIESKEGKQNRFIYTGFVHTVPKNKFFDEAQRLMSFRCDRYWLQYSHEYSTVGELAKQYLDYSYIFRCLQVR